MASILLSGPAGAGKSQEARRLRASNPGPAVIADFQSIYAAIAGDVRGPDGKFPLRDAALLPTAEYVRQALITGARQAEIDIIATNSDGSPARRRRLLDRLGAGVAERIVDPGREIVSARLSDTVTGSLAPECQAAISRWYERL